MTEKQEISQLILEAAQKRFDHYGYQKTSMAEVAKDLSMSTGNLYRYFPSKLDLAQDIASIFLNSERKLLEDISNENISAPEKIRKFFLRILTDTYNHIERDCKISNIIQILRVERPDYLHNILKKERQILIKIYEEGRDANIFKELTDPDIKMEAFQNALLRYRYPQIYMPLEFEYLEQELNNIIDILLDGIKIS